MRLFLPLFLAATGAFAAGPDFEVRDTAGARHTAQEWRGKKAVVVFFTMTDCPLSNGYVPEMNRIQAEYAPKGVAVYAAHSDSTVSDSAVRKHAQEFAFTFPVFLDVKLALAKAAGANVVPEVAVFNAAGELQYLGRIDDRMQDITRRKTVASSFELRDALDAVIVGKIPKITRTRAVGCSINLEGVK
ncbi:MAG: redoxin domain-containing protein [Acidobacteriota bacterium]